MKIGPYHDCPINEEELKIINEYSKEALDIYQELFNIQKNNTTIDEFNNRYIGHFSHPHKFVDECLRVEDLYEDLPWYLKNCIDDQKDYLYEIYMNDYIQKNDHYFWVH